MPEAQLKALLAQHDMPASFIYLAPVLPIVGIMWADHHNQLPEQKLVEDYLRRHCAGLNDMAGGMQVISDRDLALFQEQFVRNRPSTLLLEQVTELGARLVASKTGRTDLDPDTLYDNGELLHACMEIAAACPVQQNINDPQSSRKRIADYEQQLIEEMLGVLKTSGQ